MLGFNVQELDHNQRIALNDNLNINILAADFCDPSLCYKQMGCAVVEEKFGATHIDSMCVIDNGEQTIVNTNDCPFDIAKFSCFEIKKFYDKIDLLLVGYAGAGPYPQCFENLSDSQKLQEAEKKKIDFYQQAESYINLLKPKYYMPFAGRYTLAGNLANLNNFRGVPELEEAYTHFTTTNNIDQNDQNCIILNSEEYFNIDVGKSSHEYVHIDINKKLEYIEKKLSSQKYDYEYDDDPNIDNILKLLPNCYDRFEKMRQRIHFSSKTQLLLNIPGKNIICISCDGDGFSLLLKTKIHELEKYVMFTVDPRLLIRLLRGPKFAHWNNAEIGSHILFERKPNEFERGLYYCICFFHI
jgi:UDP-MurNAc hydroxylase